MAIVAMMATMSASAQYAPGTWSFKPVIGLGFSHITNMESLPITDTNLDSQITYAIRTGVDFEYQASDFLGIAAGVNYTMQGCGWEE